jgi:ATP-dependent helicase/nuclease subunit B
VREAVVPPLVSLFSALNNAKCVTDLCRAIFDFLNILDIPEKLRKQAHEQLQAGERREAEELSRLYNVTVDALESISAAMGDRPMSVAEYADALKLVFSHTDIGSIPTSADEVTIGSASMLRADHPRFVLIAGLNDGVFPATVKDDGLLGEADCRRLTELGIEFPSGNEKKMSDELFYA